MTGYNWQKNRLPPVSQEGRMAPGAALQEDFMAGKLLAIDGNSLVFRAYWALPTTMQDKDGRPTNAVYGFFTMLFRVVEEYQPTHIAVAFDRKEKTFRHEKYAEYKAGRRKTPEELLDQIPMLQDALGKVGIHYAEQAGYEADDIIGALSKRCV